MAFKDSSMFTRFKFRRTEPALAAPEPEWRENLRDTGLMLSGIYQDLRGDTHDFFVHIGRGLKAGLKKTFGPRED